MKKLILITLIIGIVVFGFVPFKIIEYHTQSIGGYNTQNIFSILILIFIVLIFILAIFFAPRKYIVTDTQIVVVRLGPNVAIPIDYINDSTVTSSH